jgi:cobalt/nickel transport system permease protein
VHISEGILSAPVWVSGAALTAGGVAIGLRKMDYDRIPRVAILSSAFFVASLIHIQVGPSSVHLILNGLAGLILGWAVFPALLVALLLQAVLFQFGGLTTLGVNTLNMALPGLVCYYLFRKGIRHRRRRTAMVAGFFAGAVPIALAGAMMLTSLILSAEALREPGWVVFYSHAPVMVIEGFITAAVVGFLRQVRPDLLKAPVLEAK